jgi:transposase
MEEKLYIGIDLSQENLDMAAYPTGQIWQHKNNRRGIAKTVAKLKAINPTLIVMEATGGLEIPLRQALDEAGLPVAVVNPRRIREHGRAMGVLAKTDKLDAKIIAHFAAKIEPEPQVPQDKAEQALDNVITRRNQLNDMLTAERNRLRQSLDPTVLVDIKEHIKWLEAKLDGLDKEIKDRVQQNPSFNEKAKLYKSMRGVGDILSANLIAKLPELGMLNQREIAALVGVAPLNKDSGKMRGKRMIQGGRAMLRKALYMPTVVAIRFNPVIRGLYLRMVARGKLKKVALVACMHKMVTILNAMAKNNTPWSYSYTAT